MRVLCAPDKFKGSMSAEDAAAAMARGVSRAGAEAIVCPVADGGDGTVATVLKAAGGERRVTRVCGPLGEDADAAWGILTDQATRARTAVIEMASAAGLVLVPHERRDPTQTTTFGVGQLLLAAVQAGVSRIVLGIGGSATTDGGCGMAQALGFTFINADRAPVSARWITGGDLARIHTIIPPTQPPLAGITLEVACDVDNPLTGDTGAAAVYGPQKGATPDQVRSLDTGLRHVAALWRSQLHRDVEKVPGAGAAGGLGGGLLAFCGAKLRPGVALVLEAIAFERRLDGCDLCLTGEGRFDSQTMRGKACLGVAEAAARQRVPTVALVGSLEGDERPAGLFAAVRLIGPGLRAEESIRRAPVLLEEATHRLVKERRESR